MFQVHVTTLCSQIKGQHCKKEACMSQQLLTKPQEAVLHDCIEFYALIAKPLDEPDIKCITFKLSGKEPGKNWLSWYKICWPNLCNSKPSSLYPKWAQNFNPSNVAGFYELLKAIYDVYPNLLPQHIWNMDEKGL
jgi:hypothetical protein